MTLKARLEAFASKTGFAKMGICHPEDIPDAPAHLRAFLNKGYHAQMDWMAKRVAWRGNPALLWPDVRTVIMLADLYTPPQNPLNDTKNHTAGTISVYARNHDYHLVVKKRLKAMGRWLINEGGGEIKVFVDTAPVMEKALGAAAGLGWQGKHTNLVGRDLGNWFFLGAIFTTLEIAPDTPGKDNCGTCRACLDICPTDAFPAPYQLDARRCISYLTIEHKGPVAEEFRPALGNRIYGCDDCLAVCPWNKFARAGSQAKYSARSDLIAPNLAELARLDDAGFRAKFSKSPIKRIGVLRFLRNVLYAVGNSRDPGLLPAATRHLSTSDDTVRDAAQWAVGQLSKVKSSQA